MRFSSTRNRSEATSFPQAVLQGLAIDGGLYTPSEQVSLTSAREIELGISFPELAAKILHELLPELYDRSHAERICKQAFPFSPKLRRIHDSIALLELFHGPSCAFKDFGASFLASVIEEATLQRNMHTTILTATSGDTGSAVIQAFLGKEHITVVVLYPSGRISPAQEMQLATHGQNIVAIEVEGNFDDCQRIAKEIFADKDITKTYGLTSANSINIGRLIPQSFYYIYANTLLSKEELQRRVFTVPSGNFGNLTAGVLAWSWGMSAQYFLAACNANDVVPTYLNTGVFTPKPSVKTFANAMDVGNPSNFERLLAISKETATPLRDLLYSEVVLDDIICDTIMRYYKEEGVFLCPHTAVGVCASERLLEKAASNAKLRYNDKMPFMLTLATAAPGKFVEVIEGCTGATPDVPKVLSEMFLRKKKSIPAQPSVDAVKTIIQDSCPNNG